jgi:hypothetical protein
MWRPAILLCAAAALCVPAAADNDLTRLQIKVTDERGKPIDHANVRVVFKQGRRKLTLTKIQHSWELKTSQEGIAKIPPIPKGDILIQVTAPFYQTFGKTFEIEEDERTVEVRMNPPQEQYSAHEPAAEKDKQ